MSPADARPPSERAVPEGVAGYAAVLREFPDFRRLFLARVISMLGDWFSLIAVIALLREVAGSEATALSGLLILKMLPFTLATPIAGVVADRFSRITIMVASDVVRFVFILAMLIVPYSPWPVELTLVLVFLQVTGSAFFEPARAAVLPQLVPGAWLSTANALGAIMWSLTFAVGAALGGVITDVFGWRTALGLDAVTYVVSALLLLRIVLPAQPPRAKRRLDWQTATGIRDFREGGRFIAARPDVATTLFVKTGWGIAGAFTLFLTLFGERFYAIGGRPDLGVSVLFVARAIGTGVGPVLARWLLPDESPRSMRWLIAASFIWPLLCYAVFARSQHLVVGFIAVACAHFGGSTLWVYSSVILQRAVPNEFRGRVMATDLGLATLVISISIGVYGAWADRPGADIRQLTTILALSLVVPAAIWWWASKRWPPCGPDEPCDERAIPRRDA